MIWWNNGNGPFVVPCWHPALKIYLEPCELHKLFNFILRPVNNVNHQVTQVPSI